MSFPSQNTAGATGTSRYWISLWHWHFSLIMSLIIYQQSSLMFRFVSPFSLALKESGTRSRAVSDHREASWRWREGSALWSRVRVNADASRGQTHVCRFCSTKPTETETGAIGGALQHQVRLKFKSSYEYELKEEQRERKIMAWRRYGRLLEQTCMITHSHTHTHTSSSSSSSAPQSHATRPHRHHLSRLHPVWRSPAVIPYKLCTSESGIGSHMRG